MRSAAGVRLCRRRHFSTSSPLGWPRGRSRGLRRGGGAGPGGASRMLRAAPSPSRTRAGARRGRPSHRHRTLAPPPPAGRSVPPPPRPRNGPSRLSALPALCSPPPSAVAVRGARAEQGTEWPRCRRGSDFSRIRAANSADPFLWLVLGCGWLAGRSGEEPLGRGRRAWKTRLHAPRQATAPRAGSGSVVNPGEERVASCQLHCPKIQMWGFGVVGSLLFITQGKKILAAA